ncbi:MAG: D-glycero-beta-D-manno-heptose 1,7-bisphosphate 7-phosphatase [Pseudomonadota bacterium]
MDNFPLHLPKAIFLDRDGVINHDSDEFVKTLEEWIPIPGSIDAIAALCRAHIKVFIITNQSGIGRGLITPIELNKMHQQLAKLLLEKNCSIQGIYSCPHHPDDNCECRKPKPGLVIQALQENNLNPHECWMIGDSYRDLESAWNARCGASLVLSGKGEKTLKKNPELIHNIAIFENLLDVVQRGFKLSII